MSKPNIAARAPAVLELEPGTYFWCRCGQSKSQPFCDGSHKQAGVFQPLEFKVEVKRRVALCQCKHTGGQPFCDGTHKKLT